MEKSRSRPSDEAEAETQRNYYGRTANQYDGIHLRSESEHYLALRFLESVLDQFGIRSVLDVGAGTGRVARHFKRTRPDLRVVSLEPVAELRQIGYRDGLGPDELIDGDAYALPFAPGSFDLVCEFGMLHHVKFPSRAVAEMLRVGKRGIFISDINNFGNGAPAARFAKQIINAMGLWKFADSLKTRGRGYEISDGDGLAYSYSVYNDFAQISRLCDIYSLNTQPGAINPYRSASHVALLGIRRSDTSSSA